MLAGFPSESSSDRSNEYELEMLSRSCSSTSGHESGVGGSHTTGTDVGVDGWTRTSTSECATDHESASVSASTYRKNLWGWYIYAFASEVFVIVSLTLFLPICLEQYARDNGYLMPERVVPCVVNINGGGGVNGVGGGFRGGGVGMGYGVGMEMGMTGTGTSENNGNGSGGGGAGACAVRLGWVWVDTTSFSLYVYSISVALQAITVISMGGIADHPPHRKRILLTFASLGSLSAILFFFLPSSSTLTSSSPSPPSSPLEHSHSDAHRYTWLLSAPLAILANIGLGASLVALNAYIPSLARRAPEVVNVNVGVLMSRSRVNKGGTFFGDGDECADGDSSVNGGSTKEDADADEEIEMEMEMEMEIETYRDSPPPPPISSGSAPSSRLKLSNSKTLAATANPHSAATATANPYLKLNSNPNLNVDANDSTPLLHFDLTLPLSEPSCSGAPNSELDGTPIVTFRDTEFDTPHRRRTRRWRVGDVANHVQNQNHIEMHKTYQTALSRTTARISSYGIAIGYGAGISVLGVVLLVMMLANGGSGSEGETRSGYAEGGGMGARRTTEALRKAIGASGVWWAVFTVPAGMWLPDSDYISSSPPPEREGEMGTVLREGRRRGRARGVGEKRGLKVSKEIGDAWVRLGNMLRWREVNKLRNTFKFLAAWFLLSDGLTTISSTTLLFSKTTLRMSPSSLVLIGILTPTSGILSSLLFPYIQRRYGFSTQRILLLLGIMASLVPAYGVLGLFLTGSRDPLGGLGGEQVARKRGWGGLTTQGEMFAVAVYFGAVYAAFQGYARAFYAELLPPSDGARWYALFSIAGKSSSFVGPVIVGLISDTTGNIRYSFVFLVCMIWAALPVLASVDVDRGRRDAAGYEYEEDVEDEGECD